MTFERLLNNHIATTPCDTEADYLDLWQSVTNSASDPFSKAVGGGLQADRLARVFIAGYQAAIRQCFELPEPYSNSQWLTFAVSEDRSQEAPLPGVIWEKQGEALVLNGYKTWIAASDNVAALIVKAGRGAQARYVLVDRSAAGLEITSKDKPSFLPDLSQGKASFKNVIARPMTMAENRLSQFPATEAFMIYTAFVACIWSQSRQNFPDFEPRCVRLLQQAQHIFDTNMDTISPAQLKDYDTGVQALLRDWLALPQNAESHWHRDRRLIQMYSGAIQA